MTTNTDCRLRMMFKCAVMIAGTLLCCLTTLTETRGQGNQAVSFDDVLNGIKNSEKKLLNVRVDGKRLLLEWELGKQDWHYAGESDVTAWYIGVPGSKVKIDIHKEVIRWQDGPAPFVQMTTTRAYNGRIGQQLTMESGPPDNPVKLLEGQIIADRPVVAVEGFASGWPYSLYGCCDQMEMRLSEYLGKYLKLMKKQCGVLSTVNPVRFDNRDCIELVIQVTPAGEKPQKEIWYFDPSRGYAILFHDDTALGSQFTVESLVEPVPGVYYPVKATILTKDKSGQPQTKALYHASVVVANDPNFSDGIFTIKWPPGTRVEDKISGATFTVAPRR